MEVLKAQGVDLARSRILVIGRSRILGSPLAHALLAENATVTVAHSFSEDLEDLVRASDVVISCAGVPGLVKGNWIKPGAGVVSVGTTFDGNTLVGDLNGIENFSHASFVATSPGGIGPLSLALLFRNVVEAAKRRGASDAGADSDEPGIHAELAASSLSHWSAVNGGLERTLDVCSHSAAADLLKRAGEAGDKLNHHIAHAHVEHRCEDGVRVVLRLYTTSTGGVTARDAKLAAAIDRVIQREDLPEVKHTSSQANLYNVPQNTTCEFVYKLPSERIAAFPTERGGSRLLVHVPKTTKGIERFASDVKAHKGDKQFAEIVDIIPEYAHLVFNESRVFDARVWMNGRVEVLFLSPLEKGTQVSGAAQGQLWKSMVRQKRVSIGDTFTDSTGALTLEVEKVLGDWIEDGEDDGVEVAARVVSVARGLDSASLGDILKDVGEIPLPPYLNRAPVQEDDETYQTVYAKDMGSVAAPTAGLHFTHDIMSALGEKGVKKSKLCLHVGAGTFKPMSGNVVSAHDMHEEEFSISVHEINNLLESAIEGRPLIAVGTTSARVLESLYWLEVTDGWEGGAELGQWNAYQACNETRVDVLAMLKDRAMASPRRRLEGRTRLCIAPGYSFKMIDGLVTNFHAPDSTLMMLVAAFVGGPEQIKEVYAHAIASEYRFLSYGDSSLLLRCRE